MRAATTPRRHRPGAVALLLASLAIAAGCTRDDPAPQRPVASIRDLMDALVDPSADALWDSVGTVSTKAGTVEKQPRTPAEWTQARRQALTIVEAANLLLVDGRRVLLPNQSTDDAAVKGILAPDEIQKKIDADRPRFVRHAHALQDAGNAALAAIDARDAGRLIDAGDRLDKACEACHATYWYPNDRRPTPTWPPQAAALATSSAH